MTKEEAAVVAAYTGVMLGKFEDMHAYIEKIMGRPVWTHEMADREIQAEIKQKAKPDFIVLKTDE